MSDPADKERDGILAILRGAMNIDRSICGATLILVRHEHCSDGAIELTAHGTFLVGREFADDEDARGAIQKSVAKAVKEMEDHAKKKGWNIDPGPGVTVTKGNA